MKNVTIFEACEKAGTLDRVFYFFSTSKVSFPGGGVEPTGASYDDFYLDNE